MFRRSCRMHIETFYELLEEYVSWIIVDLQDDSTNGNNILQFDYYEHICQELSFLPDEVDNM